MTFIHVDTNKYARIEMQEEIPTIEPKAVLYSFERPEDALEFAQKQGCDVLLTEIEFWSEKYGGIRFAKAMKEINSDIKIIFVTLCNINEVVRELKEIKYSDFLSKPWAKEKLAAVLNIN